MWVLENPIMALEKLRLLDINFSFQYVVEKHGKTLLPQYLGMYRLTVEGSETYWIVMRNIFGRKYLIHKKFDLKVSE